MSREFEPFTWELYAHFRSHHFSSCYSPSTEKKAIEFSWYSTDKNWINIFPTIFCSADVLFPRLDTLTLVKIVHSTIPMNFFTVGNRWNYRDPLSAPSAAPSSYCVKKWIGMIFALTFSSSSSLFPTTDGISHELFGYFCMCCTMSDDVVALPDSWAQARE